MKSLGLLALLVALAVVGWLAWRSEGPGRGGAAAPAARAATPERDETGRAAEPRPLEPATPPPSGARSLPAEDARLDAEAIPAGAYQTFPLDDARWIEVTVHFPRGAPPEDEPNLLGLARKDNGDFEVWGTVQLCKKIGLDDAFARDRELTSQVEWSRRPLAASMRMPFPAGAREGVLVLQSRYLHLDPLTLTLETESATTIEPTLGAWVTGRCVFPEGSTPAADEIEIELDGRSRKEGLRGFRSPDSRSVRVDASYAFELRALAADKKYAVVGHAKGFVSHFDLSYEARPGQHQTLEIEFRRGATVSGIVRGDGQPLAGVEVSTERTRGMPWDQGAETLSAEDGTFELAGIAGGEVVLQAKKDGWLQAESEPLTVAEDQETGGIVLELSSGKRVSGSVRWPDGRPVPEAQVTAFRTRDRWVRSESHAQTDAEGNFTLGGLGDEEIEIEARHEKRAQDPGLAAPALADLRPASPLEADAVWSVYASGVVPGTSGLALTLQAPLAVVGSVRDDAGTPLTRFQVEAHPEGQPENSPQKRFFEYESESGDFLFPVPAPGTWSFVARVDGRDRESEAASIVVPQGVQPLVLVLTRGSQLAGVVLSPAGAPLPGAAIHVSDDPRMAAFRSSGDGEAKSGPDGRFVLSDVKPGSSIHATHADWAPSEALTPELAAGERREDLVLVLRQGVRITGEVFDAEGKPQANQNVTCASGPMASMAFGFGGEGAALSDAAGHFEFEHIAPGKITVSAVPSEEEMMQKMQEGADETAFLAVLSDMRTATVEVADGGEAHVVLGAKPKKPVRVHGVVTAAGSPMSEAQVLVFAEGGALFQGMKLASTDQSGRYEIVLDRPGDYVFGIGQDSGFEGTGAPIYVEVPEVEEFEQDLALPLGRIAGTVLGPDGPAPGIPMRLVSAAGMIGLDDLSESHRATSGGQGAFAFEHLAPGDYAIEAGAEFGGGDDDARFGQVVVDGIHVERDRAVEGVVVHLQAAGTLAGVVRDANRAPVSGVSIFVRDAAGRAISASSCTTDGAGRFTYRGIAPGRVTASAKSSKLVSPESEAVEILPGQTTEIELVVVTGTFLEVSLLDGDQEVRARLRVQDEEGRRVDGLFAMEDIASLLSEGFSSRQRRVGPLAPGKYTLLATSLDGKDAKKTVTVSAGQEERTVKLRLR